MPPAPPNLGSKLALRLIVPFCVLLILGSLDRVNVSFAALQMNAELGLTAETYGFGVSIFFLGYIALQYPHIWVQQKIGARLWIFGAVLFWGAVATAMAFVSNKTEFYVLRFLLGVAEAGFAPGIVLYMKSCVPARYRGLAIAGAMLAIPISIVAGAPFSGWLLSQQNPIGFSAWRWMFLTEGLLTVLTAATAYLAFRDRYDQVSWLTDEEKLVIRDDLEREAAAQKRHATGAKISDVLATPRTWAAAIAHFGLLAGAYTIIFWLPLALKQMSDLSNFEASVFSAAPWIAFGSGMMLNAWHSDRTQERHAHFTISALLSALFLCATALLPAGAVAFGCLITAAFFMGGAQGTFWPIPTGFLTGPDAALGVAIVNMAGNSAGVLIQPLIGWIVHTTGSFAAPIFILSGLMGLSALMIPLIALLGRRSAATSPAPSSAA